MTGMVFGVLMFICIAPLFWIFYFSIYPKKWEERKQVFGVSNRREFREDGVKEQIGSIVVRAKRQALIISITGTVVAVVLLFMHGMIMELSLWCVFLYLSIVAIMIPYMMGHKELMTLKRSLKIPQEKGVSYVDLKTAGAVHGLRPVRVILPDLAGLIIVTAFLLIDTGVIRTESYDAAGGFYGTIVSGTIWVTGVVLTLFAFLMDNMKNEVISADSDVNANYNRAKKKNWADVNVACLWMNTAYLLVVFVTFVFAFSEMMIVGGIGLYMLLLMGEIAVFLRANNRIEKRYQKDMQLVQDDDEYWIGGMIYCNPNDRRVMVEKRAGFGGTMNLGHPAGKVIGAVSCLAIVGALLSLVWAGMIEVTPISVRIENGDLICHQLRDEYVIALDEIESAEWGEDINGLKMVRTNGVGMNSLLKGHFTVEGKSGCILFLDPREKVYIQIATKAGELFYINSGSGVDTRQIYEEISDTYQ